MSPFAKAFFVVILSFSQTFLASSACQGDDCKVEAPQDEVSLIQTKMEPKQPHRPSDDMLDAAKEAIAEEVEEGKKQLRAYVDGLKSQGEAEAGERLDDAAATRRGYEEFQNATTLGLQYSTSCPSDFDATEASNKATFQFADDCLESVQVGQLPDAEMAKLNACTGGKANNVVAYQQNGVKCTTKSDLYNGGICNAKVYKIKCKNGKVSPQCMQRKLYRGYTKDSSACHDSTGWDCARAYGGFWAAVNPVAAGISKQDYRERYAVCEGWNANLDGLWEANIGESTGCGKYVLIGNGEQVKNCPKPITKGSETYAYSPYLQVVTCWQPWNLMPNGQDLSVAGWH